MRTAENVLTKNSKGKQSQWENKRKGKKWFDGECQNSKPEVRKIGRDKYFNPNDNLLKTKYHQKLREYKSKCKSKRY